MDRTAIASTPGDGARLCDFVPRQSVALALGTDEIEVLRGDAEHDTAGELVFAGCHIGFEGQDDAALDISVDWALGIKLSGFEDRLRSDEHNQIPADDGLGFSWTQRINRPDGSDGDSARAWLVHGDRLIDVWITLPPQGRDSESDAVAIAQQVTQTLELSDEWTLQGEPPAR